MQGRRQWLGLEPQPLTDDGMTERSLARRLGAMEYREYAGGWRMRPVDDETEGLANECTRFDQRIQNALLDTLFWMIMMFFGRRAVSIDVESRHQLSFQEASDSC